MNFKIINGNFSYNQRPILKDVNLSIDSGDVLSVLGPNGAGKTTMLKCAIRLLKWKNGGSYIDEVAISEMSSQNLWTLIGYIPQSKEQYAFTVLDMVVFGRAAHIGFFNQPSPKDIEIANNTLEELNISHLSNRLYSSLSGGEAQMVLIARALVTNPKIIILDEPESNLDFKNQRVILSTIEKMSKAGLICIFNTHYPNHAFEISNKTLLLSKDGSHIFGNTKEIITEENLNKIFDVPVKILEHKINGKSHYSILAL